MAYITHRSSAVQVQTKNALSLSHALETRAFETSGEMTGIKASIKAALLMQFPKKNARSLFQKALYLHYFEPFFKI